MENKTDKRLEQESKNFEPEEPEQEDTSQQSQVKSTEPSEIFEFEMGSLKLRAGSNKFDALQLINYCMEVYAYINEQTKSTGGKKNNGSYFG